MEIRTSHVSLEYVPEIEIAKVEAAAEARDRLAMIQHGCSGLTELPDPVLRKLDEQFVEAAWNLAQEYARPLGAFDVRAQ